MKRVLGTVPRAGLLVLLAALLLVAGSSTTGSAEALALSMGNPAAVYCQSLGYTLQPVSAAGGQSALCILPDGTQCEQWDFLRGTCGVAYGFCAQHGYDTVTLYDGGNGLSASYAACVNPADGAVIGAVTDLADLHNNTATGCNLDQGDIRPVPTDTLPPVPPDAELPATFDWRDYAGGNWMTDIRNQGSCGSCWAFGAVGIVEAMYNITFDNPDYDLDLSEQYLVADCSNAGSCCGGWHDSALAFIRYDGIPDEACMPYVDGTGCSCPGGCGSDCTYRSGGQCSDNTCSDRCGDWESRLYFDAGWAYVSSDRTAIQNQVVNNGPVTIAIGVGSSYGAYWDGDIYRCTVDYGANHAVAIVGYNDAEEYWIVRNSWGTGWGEDGYFKMGYGECNVENYVYTTWVRPENDDFDSATVVTQSGTLASLPTTGATSAPDDPIPSCGSGTSESNSVWYRYTAASDGVLNVTAEAATTYDTVLAIWSGARGSLTEAGCADATDWLAAPMTSGETYYVEVLDYDANPGGGMLSLSLDFNDMLGSGYYQEDHALLMYHGEWRHKAKSGASGGWAMKAKAGASVEFWFVGEMVSIFRRVGPNEGDMQVCVDGTCELVDNYRGEGEWTAPVTFGPFPSGPHQVEVSRPADQARFWFDAFEVINLTSTVSPLTAGALYHDDAAQLLYVGNWITKTKPSAIGGVVAKARRPYAGVAFHFSGTQFTLYRRIGPVDGSMTVCIDGVCQQVSNFSAVKLWGQPVTFSGLSDGPHLVAVYRNPGGKLLFDGVWVGANPPAMPAGQPDLPPVVDPGLRDAPAARPDAPDTPRRADGPSASALR